MHRRSRPELQCLKLFQRLQIQPYNLPDQSLDHRRTEEEDHQMEICQEDSPLQEEMLEEQDHQRDLWEDHQEDCQDCQKDLHR